MAVTVKKLTLWRTEVDNRPGALASTLEPLARAGADLTVVMGYRFPGMESRGAIEIHPVAGRKVIAAAKAAGLSASTIPTLLVEGDNRPGLGHAIAQAVAESEINLSFVLAQVIGPKYSAIFGFEAAADADRAAKLIKKVSARKSGR